MSDRTIKSVTETTPQPGTGILHPFPTAEVPHLDPFVFLDTGAPRDLGTHDIYVGPHSHRGVQPVSLLFRGRIEHRDITQHDRIDGVVPGVRGQRALPTRNLGVVDPFVMNTTEQISQARADFAAGLFDNVVLARS